MSGALPRTIQNYIDASNAHDVQSILACLLKASNLMRETRRI
jgi:hypothetical protein